MTFSIVTPVYDLAGQPERERAASLVRQHLLGLACPSVVTGGPSAAAARNRGAATLTASVLVFNDADTVVPLDQIRRAAMLAEEAPGLVFAFDQYKRLSQSDSWLVGHRDDWLNTALTRAPTEILASPPSHGCVAISRACFDQVGGYDERLEVYEDCAFTARCEERWPSRRVTGPAVHLWHPRPFGDVDDPAFQDRFGESRRVWLLEYPEAWPEAIRVG